MEQRRARRPRDRRRPPLFLGGFLAILVLTLVIVLPFFLSRGGDTLDPSIFSTASQETVIPERTTLEVSRELEGKGERAPDFAGIVSWINSQPLTMEKLRGKVVMVDFWTYTCVNCIRTLKYLQEWHNRYADKGLVIVGVHSPEFQFEEDLDNLSQAIQREGIGYVVAQDNDFATWRAYENRYWPHKFLIDADGFVRYDHIGEGSYAETEGWIQKLLQEAGAEVGDIEVVQNPELGPQEYYLRISPETYLGVRGALEGSFGALLTYQPREVTTYTDTDPGSRVLNLVHLQGPWYNGEEELRHARATQGYEDYLAIKYRAKTVNLVINKEQEEPYRVLVWLDGKFMDASNRGLDVQVDEEGRSFLLVDEPRMYSVVNTTDFDTHELKLSSNSDAFAMTAFTFGAVGVP